MGDGRLEEVSLTIDGKAVRCAPGTSVWNVAQNNGIRIPSLCNHPELKPAGACRICLVEDAESGRIMASCVTPASQGMNIKTNSAEVLRHRTNIVRLIMANHPESCILCDKGNRCGLREIAAELGVGRIDLYPMNRFIELEEANPFIVRDLTKCILCGRCIRADRELVVVGAIDYHFRGFEARPSTLHQQPLEKSSCTFCGTCVAMCPTGALRTKTKGYAGSPEKWNESVCGFCGVGCSLSLGSSAGRVVDVEPSQRAGTVNRTTLCVRGHFENDYLSSGDRLKSPTMLRDGERIEVSWGEAVSHAADQLKRIRKEYGPQGIAFWGSTRCSLEENYLFQIIARALLGTNTIVSGREPSRYETFLRSYGIRTINELEKAEAILVIGSNPTDSSPVLGYAVKRAVRLNNTRLVVIDPIKTDLVPFADSWLPVRVGRDAELVNALSAMLYMAGTRPESKPEGYDRFVSNISGMDMDPLCRRAGLEKKSLQKAAEALEGKKIAIVVGDGIVCSPHSEDAFKALGNLALLTDSLSGLNRGFFIPAKENNHEGALDMGACPGLLPGRLDCADKKCRTYWERIWGASLSPDAGLNAARIIEEIGRGHLKALYIMGENPVRTMPQPEKVKEAFHKLELLIVQDILHTGTDTLSHVSLPGAAFCEKQGTFTNMEGRIQCFDSAVPAPAEARPDWQVLAALYDRLAPTPGKYGSIEDIRKEIRDHVPGYQDIGIKNAGTSTPRFKKSKEIPVQEEYLGFQDSFSSRPDAAGEDDYPLIAIFMTPRSHVGGGTRTSRSRRLSEFTGNGDLVLSPGDFERLALEERTVVRLVSAVGSIERSVIPSERVPLGCVLVPTGFQGNSAMEIAESSLSGFPEKTCRVRLETP